MDWIVLRIANVRDFDDVQLVTAETAQDAVSEQPAGEYLVMATPSHRPGELTFTVRKFQRVLTTTAVVEA